MGKFNFLKYVNLKSQKNIIQFIINFSEKYTQLFDRINHRVVHLFYKWKKHQIAQQMKLMKRIQN